MAKKKKKTETEEIVEVTEKEKTAAIEASGATDIFDEADSDGLRIEVARQRDESGEWEYFWLLYAANGRPVATGPESHKRLNDLKTTTEGIAETMKEAPIVRLY